MKKNVIVKKNIMWFVTVRGQDKRTDIKAEKSFKIKAQAIKFIDMMKKKYRSANHHWHYNLSKDPMSVMGYTEEWVNKRKWKNNKLTKGYIHISITPVDLEAEYSINPKKLDEINKILGEK